jgi:hypothetical protein
MSASGGGRLPLHSTAAAPVSNASDIRPADSNVAGDGRHGRTPLVDWANVVANCAVGFGPPLTVTVGLDGKGWEVELLELELAMENLLERPYMTPWVTLTKMRK